MVNYTKNSVPPPSIQEKIELAHTLHTTWGNKLLRDSYIYGLSERLKQNIDTTRKAMRALGIIDVCRDCEEDGGGSCCGAGTENKYNWVLLLINLILGISLPDQRYKANSCYFLNEDGCTLMARHVLCVNYLCSKINQILTPDELIRLQFIAGNELDTIFILHEAIKNFTSRSNNGQQLPQRNPFSNR
jgi:hypothetical protein